MTTDTYYGNVKKLNEIIKDLNIIKSNLPFVIPGLSPRYLTMMTSPDKKKRKKFPLHIYERLGREFNKLYSKKPNPKTIDYNDLFIKIIENNDKQKTVYLEKLTSYSGHLAPFGGPEQLIFNKARVNNVRASVIQSFCNALKEDEEREDKYKWKFFSGEEQLEQIKDHANVNTLIDRLDELGISIFTGSMFYPQIQYGLELSKKQKLEHESYKVTTEAKFGELYLIILFSEKSDGVEFFKFKYSDRYTLETYDKLIAKFPHSFEYHIHLSDDRKLKPGSGYHHDQIINQIAQFYLDLEFNENFKEIIPDVFDLRFSYLGKEIIEPEYISKKQISENKKNEKVLNKVS